MQDIGGCRAVLPNARKVIQLVNTYKKSQSKNPSKRCYCDGFDDFDYIHEPKPDGYRSIHLIARFRTSSSQRKMYNEQRIEIQIRSKLQHLWATAVETAQVFTGQALKSKFKNATEDWLRFFALTSNAFALRERMPPVPGTPEDREQLVSELKSIVERANIMDTLWGLSNTVRHIAQHKREVVGAQMFLLVLDPATRELSTTAFSQEEIVEAQKEYQEREKDADSDPNKQVVLVSVESVDALRKAYPNYYVDTKEFINAVWAEMHPNKKQPKRKTTSV